MAGMGIACLASATSAHDARRARNFRRFTLTSGILAMQPMPGSASVAMVNAALEGFVRAAALEIPRRLRINAVSPPWVKETMVRLGMDPTPGLASAEVAKAYVAGPRPIGRVLFFTLYEDVMFYTKM